MSDMKTETNPNDPRLSVVRRLLRECFWGDYLLSAEEILARLDRNESGFARFIFSKIIENGSFPSRDLPLLFTAETLQALLARYLLMTEKQRGRNNQRVRLVAANLTGHYDLVPELQWQS